MIQPAGNCFMQEVLCGTAADNYNTLFAGKNLAIRFNIIYDDNAFYIFTFHRAL